MSPGPTPRRVLMVAYHFPPLAGSSGIQRTLRFVQQLPAHGWEPLLLVPDVRAYERTSDDLMADVPAGTVVRRAFALDTARHLSIGGSYVGAWARPDRWVSWRFDGVRQGLKLVQEFKPQALWSTFPIATAHLIGAELQRRTGLPWIADFRDPMAQEGYPVDPKTRQAYRAIEQRAISAAACSLFTTPSAVAEYRQRYPQRASRIDLLENGYDEESFVVAERNRQRTTGESDRPRVLLHSGIVYPEERDPRQLLDALRLLHDEGSLHPGRLLVRFRAPVHEAMVRDLARERGVEAYVEVCPPVAYVQALKEMLDVDALLVLQAASCNQQVPAKLYEYARSGRPILCLTDPAGDTALVLRSLGVDRVARLDRVHDIAALLRDHLAGRTPDLVPDPLQVAQASRLARTEELAGRLDALVESPPP